MREKRDEIAVGVIGAGRIGRLHARNLAQHIHGARFAGIADVDIRAAVMCVTEMGVEGACEDPARLFEDPSVDAIVICSSTDTHAPLIEAAAQAGKHIFCEKPIALDLDAIDQALEAVSQSGVKLQVGFNRRFDPGFARAREVVAEGTLGKVHLLRISSRDPEPPPLEYLEVSGGIFLDMTIHDFDMARFLVGDEVEEVFAVGAALVDPAIGEIGDVDTACVTLRFAGGTLGVIDNSRRATYGYDQRAEVFGERGMVQVGNRKPHRTVISDREGERNPANLAFFVERYAEAFVRELQAFVDAVREERDVPVTGQDGRVPVVMGYAAKRSLELGRPVTLTEIEAGLSR